LANILVVDDEKNVLELVAYLLEKDGHIVKTAPNGQACLDAVAQEKPDLIVLDVMMPEMDGYSVSNALAADDATREIPILILSAKGQLREAFSLSRNVVAYLEKPFDPTDLRNAVSRVLQGRAP
jgi:two-component system, OmpR family, alkaline phosphatase synthesis response regulator PhoP